jgi:hypothetical protein
MAIQVLLWLSPKEFVLQEFYTTFNSLTPLFKYLPLLIDKVEKVCEEYGLRNDSIVMRMTGCPNGCTRPYLAGSPHSCSFHKQ